MTFILAIAIKILFNIVYLLPQNTLKPADAIFVLGGSIQREIYVAEIANRYPDLPILISRGSDTPCIQKIFLKLQARMNNVWIENCANSTFENFFFGVPIIRQWGTHKVKIITSSTHLPRAQWMAQVQFGAQGIATEVELADGPGVPANQESTRKTILDLTRSILWSGLSPVISPYCSDLVELINFNEKDWLNKPYHCEHNRRFFQ
jgi:uncharacterized SAM-binding protein YcdF (DUF218 family)